MPKRTRPGAARRQPRPHDDEEHDTAGDILRALRAAAADYAPPADACISYQTLCRALEEFEQDLHQHIHLENNVLFPRAVELEESGRR